MNRSALATFSLATAVAVMTLGHANPSFADKPNPDHNHGGEDSEGDATFTVTITGGLGLQRDGVLGLQGKSGVDEDEKEIPWVQGVVGKNGIGLNDASGDDVGTLTGVGGFFPLGRYQDCFDDKGTVHEFSPKLHQAFIKPGKKGRAEASFWFHGETFEGDVRVLYVLKLFGKFEDGKVWPGTQTLEMDKWELKVENEGKTIKGISCLGEGGTDPGDLDPDLVEIKVTATVDTS